MTGDHTPDLMALLSADIIISTPEKWDGISRNWHSRSYVTKVISFIFLFIIFLLSNLSFCLQLILTSSNMCSFYVLHNMCNYF